MRNLLSRGGDKGKLAIRASMVRRMVLACERSWMGMRFACTAVSLIVIGVRIGHIAPYSNMPHHTKHLILKRHVTCYRKGGRWWKAKVVQLDLTKVSVARYLCACRACHCCSWLALSLHWGG